MDSQATHIGRLEAEIRELRAKNEASEAQALDATKLLDEQAKSHEKEKSEMESGYLQEKAQLMLDFEKEKADMEAKFVQEKMDLKAEHAKDKQDTKMETERAGHLESSQQRLTLQTVQGENRHLRSKNEDRC